MVGNDEVEAEFAGASGFGEGAHTGIYADDQMDAIGGCGFKNGSLDAVALTDAMGHVKADGTSIGSGEHLDGSFEEHYGGGAVDVVVAVEQDGFALGYGLFEAIDGGGHAEHFKGIDELADLRVKESVGSLCGLDAAGEQKAGEDLGNMSRGGKRCGLGVRGADLPALRWRGKRWS